MKGMRIALRVGLLSMLTMLVFGVLGSGAMANDLFDDDYTNCSPATRLDALTGLAVSRTDEEDELKVQWDLPDASGWRLGSPYTTNIVILVEVDDEVTEKSLNLGQNSVTVDGIGFAEDVRVEAAVADRGYVLSDITGLDWTSGIPAPSFKLVQSGGRNAWMLEWYMLGYGEEFRNFLEDTDSTENRRVRVGLKHPTDGSGNEIDMGDADFETYRIQIEDEHGDVVKYLAGTLDSDNIYDGNKMIFRKNPDAVETQLSSIRKSSRLVSTSPNSFMGGNVVTLTIDRNVTVGDPGFFEPMLDVNSQSQVQNANLGDYWNDADGNGLYASGEFAAWDTGVGWSAMHGLVFPKPSAYHAFPPDTFDVDGEYTITAYAENEDGNQISPTTSLKINSTMGLGDLVPPDILSDTNLDLESVWQIILLDE